MSAFITVGFLPHPDPLPLGEGAITTALGGNAKYFFTMPNFLPLLGERVGVRENATTNPSHARSFTDSQARPSNGRSSFGGTSLRVRRRNKFKLNH